MLGSFWSGWGIDPCPLTDYNSLSSHPHPMTEAYAIFTTGNGDHDRPELFGLYASAEKAEADAALLRERLQDADCATYTDQPLYAQVSVAYVPIRF
jgi:hypothetical protein